LPLELQYQLVLRWFLINSGWQRLQLLVINTANLIKELVQHMHREQLLQKSLSRPRPMLFLI
jgi:hypothetical protein